MPLIPPVGPGKCGSCFSKNKILNERFNMAGKKKTPNRPTDSNWGGKRSNQTGRPPKVAISQYQLDQMLAKAEKWAKKHKGMTVDDYLLKWIYGEVEDDFKLTMRDRIACVKIWKDYTMAKVQEKNINVGKTYPGPIIYDPDEGNRIISGEPSLGPDIFLPKEMEDPAKTILGNSGSEIYLPKRRPDPAKEILSKKEPKKSKVIKLDKKI